MINQEVGKQRFDHFKKQALLVFTTALRAPLFFMMGCGYVRFSHESADVHDHNGKLIVSDGSVEVPYNETKHGKIEGFTKEGEVVPGLRSPLRDASKPIHRHDGTTVYGPYELCWE